MGGSQSSSSEAAARAGSGCCSTCRTKPNKEPPPPGLCGYWFQNALSIEHKLGTVEARRALGFHPPPEGPYAWAIVDDRARSLEWVVGEVVDGQGRQTRVVKEKVAEWLADQWVIEGQPSLPVSNREYIDIDGRRVVTSITVSGIKLHRAFAAMVNELPVRIILSEAQAMGWERQCLEACLMEINRTMDMRAARVEKRNSMRSERSERSSVAAAPRPSSQAPPPSPPGSEAAAAPRLAPPSMAISPRTSGVADEGVPRSVSPAPSSAAEERTPPNNGAAAAATDNGS